MIAYLFWHTPRAGVDEAQYAAKLIHFHEELEQLGSGSTGLALDPVAYSLPEVPWIPVNRSIYLDVYAMDNTSRMETLNSAAVTGPMLQPHQEIAALYGSGAGSLYDVRAGQVGPATDSYWFAKPQGMTYAELDALLNPLITPGVALLRRLMVLGPSPEFCLLSPAPQTLPLTAEHRPLTTL